MTDDAMEVEHRPTRLPWARMNPVTIADWVNPYHIEQCDRGVCAGKFHYWYRYKDIVARLCAGRA